MKQILKSLELIQDGETTIEIKYEDAIDTEFMNCSDCALARAVKRELGVQAVVVDTEYVNIKDGNLTLCEITPTFGEAEYEDLLSTKRSFKVMLSLRNEIHN